MTARDELLDALTAERYQPIPAHRVLPAETSASAALARLRVDLLAGRVDDPAVVAERRAVLLDDMPSDRAYRRSRRPRQETP